MKEQDFKVDKDTAQAEFESMCDEMGVEYDADILGEEAMKAFDTNKARVVKAIMTGLVVTDGGHPIVKAKGGDVKFSAMTGGVFLQPQGKKDTDMHLMYKIAAELTGGSAKMPTRSGNEFRVMMSLTQLFIAM